MDETRITRVAIKLKEGLVIKNAFWNGAPDQNRTDTSSLEGYSSTIELQAHFEKVKGKILSYYELNAISF